MRMEPDICYADTTYDPGRVRWSDSCYDCPSPPDSARLRSYHGARRWGDSRVRHTQCPRQKAWQRLPGDVPRKYGQEGLPGRVG